MSLFLVRRTKASFERNFLIDLLIPNNAYLWKNQANALCNDVTEGVSPSQGQEKALFKIA